jgi:hypothetical protein
MHSRALRSFIFPDYQNSQRCDVVRELGTCRCLHTDHIGPHYCIVGSLVSASPIWPPYAPLHKIMDRRLATPSERTCCRRQDHGHVYPGFSDRFIALETGICILKSRRWCSNVNFLDRLCQIGLEIPRTRGYCAKIVSTCTSKTAV